MTAFEPNENFAKYLYFISERMEIFWKRERGGEPPFTEDDTLSTKKFTNVYRCLDRVSQFLIKNVIYDEKGLNNDRDTEDIFFRILLFKHFNKIETWVELEKEFGELSLETPLREVVKFLDSLSKKQAIYSNAYMMTASFMRNPKIYDMYSINTGESKHSSYLKILDKDLFSNQKVLYGILKSQSLKELYKNLNSVNTIGEFLAMQYAIDLNYSQLFNFSEDEFIIAGPGAQRGIERTFKIEGKPNYESIISWVGVNIDTCFEVFEIHPKFIPNRKPTLIDLQNCFCEVDKYLRDQGIATEGKEIEGKRVKNFFKIDESVKKEKINYFFPPKWGINEKFNQKDF